jgi:plasmid stabilization system protein ParE
VEEIVGFFATRSLGYAEKLMERIMQAPRLLASSPLLGRVVPEYAEDHIRELILRPYRLIYVVRDDTCYVVAAVHSSRDLASLFRPEDLENR